MKKGIKIITISSILLLALLISSQAAPVKILITPIEPGEGHGMAPVETTATKSSLVEVEKSFEKNEAVFRCNYNKIADLSLQNVYVDGKNDDSIFLIYDDSSEAKVADAELVIEIIPVPDLLFDAEKNKKYITTINGYTAYVNKEAPCNWASYQKLYGKYSIVIDIAIDGNNYWIRAAPTFSLTEVLDIADMLTS